MSSRLLHGRRLAAVPLLLPLLVAVGGCSDRSGPVDALPRVAVSGSVTLDGKPLPAGSIQFAPEAAEAGKGVTAVGEITDGTFTIEKDQGPVPGKYKVSISSLHGVVLKPNEMPGPPPKEAPERVPAKYNTATTLSKEVTAGGPNQFEFALTSK